jgi:two-component system chemotaxis response regulator CheY
MNKPKVLIVDDTAFMRAAIKKVLEENGFEAVGEAQNGAEAIKKYMELKPDIVTMDITMPEMSGVDSLKTLMKIDPGARIVVISAMGQQEMVREAILFGAKSFIIKPFKSAHVIQTLNKVLLM